MKREHLRLKLIENLQEIEVILHRGVENIFPGVHASILQGRGLEFETYGTYKQRGKVDWPKTLKSRSKIVVKKYHQEKEARMAVFLDLTPSMDFGSGNISKRELGILAVGALGCSAFILGDEVDLIGFNNTTERYNSIPNKDSFIEHLLDLGEFSPANQFNSSFLLEEITGYRGDAIFIVSDFISENGRDFINIIQQTTIGYEVAPILISDSREKVLPSSGVHRLKDPETGETIVIDCSNRKQKEEFNRIVEGRIKEFGEAMNKLGILWTEIREDKKWIEELIKLFLQKKFLSRRF